VVLERSEPHPGSRSGFAGNPSKKPVLVGRSGGGVTIRQKLSGPMCEGAATCVTWFADPEIAEPAALQAASAALLGGRDECDGYHIRRRGRGDAGACQSL
jgi:hypothetical protein